MADFRTALSELMELEGWPGYTADPIDHGGETFAGITRRNWPDWDGWKTIDAMKTGSFFAALNERLPVLREKVEQFYRDHYWNEQLAAIQHQALATWLFQMSVNVGWQMVVKFVQRAVGIKADGIWGKATQNMVEVANPRSVLAICRGEAIKHYQQLATSDPSQVKFLKGWQSRARA